MLLLLNPLHSCLTLYDPMDYSPPGSSLYRILQARILEWVAMPSSRGSSWPRYRTPVSYVPCMAGGFSTTNATWEAPRLIVFKYKITVAITLENCLGNIFGSYCPKETLLLFSCPVMSDSLWPHWLQYIRSSYPSSSPEVAQVHAHCVGNAIQPSHPLTPSSPSALNLSQHQGLPVNWLFTSDNQDTGSSASASVLPMSIQGWFTLRLTSLISLLSRELSGVFSSTTVRRHQFFGALPSLWSSSYNCTWPLGRWQPWLYGPLSAK